MAEADRPESTGPPGPLERALQLGTWYALCLVGARVLVLVLLERSHGSGWEMLRVRLGHSLPALAYQALLLGSAGFLLVLLWETLGLGARLRWTWRGLSLALLACGATWIAAGRSSADLSLRVGLETPRGRLVSALLLLGALALAALLLRIALRPARAATRRARWVRVLLPALSFLLGTGFLWTLRGSMEPRMLVKTVDAELFAADWEVLAAHPAGAPAARVLCPSPFYVENGAGMPALCLPPPARVRHTVRSEVDPLWLVARAGVDRSLREDLGPGYAGCSLRFRVRLDGELRFEGSIAIEDSSDWRPVGGPDGLLVRPGTVIELETALLDPSGQELEPADPLPAGFGGLDLERRDLRERARSSREAPNLVLVLVDTLRADRMSVYGHGRPTTPELERLAGHGTVFEQAHSTSSWTWPATASLLTGLLPEEHGVVDAQSSFLAETLDTLAEALQRRGYTTAAWSASPLIVPDKNFDQGFEHFRGPRDGSLRPTAEVIPPALEWLGAVGTARFFLYVHIMDPHSPLEPLPEGRALLAPDVPADFDPDSVLALSNELRNLEVPAGGQVDHRARVSPELQRWVEQLYDACVWSADHWIGRLARRLEELGLDERTVVIVTSDHGEELFDHGLLFHAHTLYRELVRVPLIAWGPGIPGGKRVTVPVSTAWLAPALARRAGSVLGQQQDALDLFALAPGPREILFSTRQGWWNGSAGLPLYGLFSEPYVLHFSPEGRPADGGEGAGPRPEGHPGEWRLFDRGRDPDEKRDLAGEDPERARRLLQELKNRLEELGQRRRSHSIPADEATLEMLRKLGYAR
jgi:arylsulfatase A-like enzyme